MAVTFYHNGNEYTIIDGTDEVQLNKLGGLSKELYIPKYALFKDKKYIVTEIVCPRREEKEYINIETDKRKKDRFEWVSRGFFDYNLAGYNIDTSVRNKVPRKTVEEKCSVVNSIIIPDSVRLIGTHAFTAFAGLQNVEIPGSVIEIGDYAFNGCANLRTITLPPRLEKIGTLVFYKAKFERITIPSSVKEISYRAFDGCSLTEVTINSDPFEIMIGSNAFPANANIIYLKPQTSKAHVMTEKQIDLDKLIHAIVTDGIITEKERSVILKKAKTAGYDPDEVEILLDAKLHEFSQKNEIKVKEKDKINRSNKGPKAKMIGSKSIVEKTEKPKKSTTTKSTSTSKKKK